MAKIKLDIEQDNTTSVFEYAGRELASSVEALLVEINKEISELERQIDHEPKIDKLPKPGMLGQTETTRQKLERKLEELIRERFDAKIWLMESKRTPRKVYKLDIAFLRWLRSRTSEVKDPTAFSKMVIR
jgi:hypothetical protein